MDYKKMTARAIVGLMVSDGSITEEIAAKYFTEFAESEDEKIRKGLINGFNFYSDQEYWGTEKFQLKIKDIIAWLEKQGEQKPAENKGMNIVEEDMTPFQKKVFCIIDTAIEEEQGLKQVCDELLSLAKYEIEQKPADLPKGEDYGIDGLYHAIRILEKTLGKVDGYQTDDGILEHECAISAVKSMYEQKPAWSEEDESIRNGIIDHLREYYVEKKGYPYVADEDSPEMKERRWLKSLKYRVQPQPKQEWSEEDVIFIEATIGLLNLVIPIDAKSCGKSRRDCIGWLQSIRKRVGCKANCTTIWKPNDEQMRVLTWCMPLFYDPNSKEILESLINDLRKIKED